MLPIVWLFGTSGVGKSTTAYAMLSTLNAAGVTAAFVDADQLRLKDRMEASETELIASALPAVMANYRRFSARVMIVAGLVDDANHLSTLLPSVPRKQILAVHLSADDGAIRDRVVRRGWRVELADRSIEYAGQIKGGFADVHIDSSHVSPAKVAARATEAVLTFLTSAAQEATAAAASSLRFERVIIVTGPAGVGVSTVGFPVFMGVAEGGTPVGYLDTRQLGFLGPDPHRPDLADLRAQNARAVIDNYTAAGAHTVVVGADAAAVTPLLHHLDGVPVSVFWLDATPDALADRVNTRAKGAGLALPGNNRTGSTQHQIEEAIRQSIDDLRFRALLPPDTTVVDTTQVEPEQVARLIMTTIG